MSSSSSLSFLGGGSITIPAQCSTQVMPCSCSRKVAGFPGILIERWELHLGIVAALGKGSKSKKEGGLRGGNVPRLMLGHLDAYGNAARGNRAVCMMPSSICASRVSSNKDSPLWWGWQRVESVGNVTRLSKLWAEICDLAQKEWEVAGALASDVLYIEVECRKKRNKLTERRRLKSVDLPETKKKGEGGRARRKKNNEMTQGLCSSVVKIV